LRSMCLLDNQGLFWYHWTTMTAPGDEASEKDGARRVFSFSL